LLLGGIFYDAVSISDYAVLSGKMIDELERFGRKQLQRNRVNILAFAKD
jgi:hypothetical protein